MPARISSNPETHVEKSNAKMSEPGGHRAADAAEKTTGWLLSPRSRGLVVPEDLPELEAPLARP